MQTSASRTIAASGLGYLGDVRAVGPLKTAAEDQSEEVSLEAACALAMLGHDTYVDTVIESFKARPQSSMAEALGKLGDPRGIGPLIDFLRAGTVGPIITRLYAARALGRLGDARAIPILEAMLDNPSSYVREAAREALDAIRNQSAASE